MIPSIFIAQNIHFAVTLFAALIFFIAGWLYLDAGSKHHPFIKASKWLGFFLVAIGLLISGIGSDNTVLATLAIILKSFGYLGIIFGNGLDPLQPRPHNVGIQNPRGQVTPEPVAKAVATPVPDVTATPIQTGPPTPLPAVGTLGTLAAIGNVVLPVGSIIITILYWRRATTGLERHLKGVAASFALLALYDILALRTLLETSANPLLQQLASPLGTLWIAEHVALLGASLMLARWVWRYLTKRPETQLFLLATSTMVTIVLTTTVTITGLLMANLQSNSLTSLTTSAKVLRFAIDGKTAGTRATAVILSHSGTLPGAIATGNHAAVQAAITDLPSELSAVDSVITDKSGQVVLRTNEPDRYGDSVSNDSLVKRALAGATVSALATRPGTITPQLVVTTASPIMSAGQTIGSVVSSQTLDNAFVDGIKSTTNLDSTVYAKNTLVATTLTAPDGVTRLVGAQETHRQVLDTTIKQGRTWQGALNVSNQAFLITYLPLKDIDSATVGMIAIGQPQATIIESSGRAINLTYLSAIVWLLIAVGPIYLISRQIARQLQ